MIARKFMMTAIAVSTLLWRVLHLLPEASAAEQSSALIADGTGKALRLWYNEPAPDSDAGWVNRSIPMGNGYMGVNVFGGTTSERIQITENSLYDSAEGRGLRRGGLNNFAEVYLDFGHNNTSNYERDLNLSEGVSHVKYTARRRGVLEGVFHKLPRQGDGDPSERVEGGGVVVHTAPHHPLFGLLANPDPSWRRATRSRSPVS